MHTTPEASRGPWVTLEPPGNLLIYILQVKNLWVQQWQMLDSSTIFTTCHFSAPASSAFSSVQFSSVAQLCPTLCDPMNRSTPGLPVHHQLPEFTQTHIHRVSDTIQPSHPLSSPSPPAPNPCQHQSLFQ